MRIHDVSRAVGDAPYMTFEQAEAITNFITDKHVKPSSNWVSRTAYPPATWRLPSPNWGVARSSRSIWNRRATRHPNVEELLDRVGERDRVSVFYEPTSYTWRLMRFLEEDPTPRFDLCYLDGAHRYVDALAFFLVDRLLRPGGWVIFDDLNWTYATSPVMKDSELVRNMPLEEDDRSGKEDLRIACQDAFRLSQLSSRKRMGVRSEASNRGAEHADGAP